MGPGDGFRQLFAVKNQVILPFLSQMRDMLTGTSLFNGFVYLKQQTEDLHSKKVL